MNRRAVIVCGAGVSSTFLARAVREVADQHDLEWEFFALAEDQLGSLDRDVSLVLVGHHLAGRLEAVRDAVSSLTVPVHLLSHDDHARAAAEAVSLLHDLEPTPTPTTRTPSMVERTLAVASAHGLHARPAAQFVKAVSDSGCSVEVQKGERKVNAASILGVVSLGIEHGDSVVLRVEGENADAVLESLAVFLEKDHDA